MMIARKAIWRLAVILALAVMLAPAGLAMGERSRKEKDASGAKVSSDEISGMMKKRLDQALKDIYNGEYEAAVEQCSHIIAIDPENAVAYKRLGSAYYLSGKLEQALSAWKKALELDPKDGETKKHVDQLSGALKKKAGK